MTIELNEDDRLYKIIQAKTGNGEMRKRFMSKIDKNGKITMMTYIYFPEDVGEDDTIKNKQMRLLIKEIPVDFFYKIIESNRLVYPNFEIEYELDLSHLTLKEAFEKIKESNMFVTYDIDKHEKEDNTNKHETM